MNPKNLTPIAVIRLQTIVRPCSMVTATSPTTEKACLQ